MSERRALLGTTLILGSATGFGLNPMLAKVLFAEGLSAEAITLFRFALPALIILPFVRVRRSEWPETLRMLIMGAANAIGILFYFKAIDTLPASTAILIYYTYPVFNVLLGWILFGRNPSRNALAAAALILVAASLTIHPQSLPEGALLPVLGCFLAPVIFAYIIQYLVSPSQPLAPTKRLAGSLLGHMLILVPLAIIEAPAELPPVSGIAIIALVAMGLFAAALPQYLFTVGAPMAGPERTSIGGAVEMVIAMLTGAVLLGENLDRLEITAILLILIALLIRQEVTQPKVEVEESARSDDRIAGGMKEESAQLQA